MLQERGFSGHNAYSVSKLANLMYSIELAPLMKARGVTVNCVHPGVVATNVLRDGWGGGGIDAKVPVHLHSLGLICCDAIRSMWCHVVPRGRNCVTEHLHHMSHGFPCC